MRPSSIIHTRTFRHKPYFRFSYFIYVKHLLSNTYLTCQAIHMRPNSNFKWFVCVLLFLAVVPIGLATAGHSGWMANLFSLVSDNFPKNAVASVIGIGTMAGALGGICVARFAGWVLDSTGSYWPLFLMSSCAYVVAWLIVQILLPKKDLST